MLIDESNNVLNHTKNSAIFKLPTKPTACLIFKQKFFVAIEKKLKLFDQNGKESFVEEFQEEIMQLAVKSPDEILVQFHKDIIVKQELDFGRNMSSYTFENAILEVATSESCIVVRFRISINIITNDGTFYFGPENISPTSSECNF